MAALSNSALVYMFEPRPMYDASAFGQQRVGTILDPAIAKDNETMYKCAKSNGVSATYNSIIMPALLIALSSSHAYLLARLVIRHLLQRAIWKGSKEWRQAKNADAEVKRLYIRNLVESKADVEDLAKGVAKTKRITFWDRDDGSYELQAVAKEE